MKSLSRPMFRRGGGVSARNNGIVSGFDDMHKDKPFAPENEERVADDG